jgi:hypothetical protein
MKHNKILGILLAISTLFATIYLNIFINPAYYFFALFLFLMLGYGIYLIDNEKTK